jgi:hypothetical protein
MLQPVETSDQFEFEFVACTGLTVESYRDQCGCDAHFIGGLFILNDGNGKLERSVVRQALVNIFLERALSIGMAGSCRVEQLEQLCRTPEIWETPVMLFAA